MVGDRLRTIATYRRALSAGASAVVIALSCAVSGSASAQSGGTSVQSNGTAAQSNGLPEGVSVPPGSKLLLSADKLVYNDRRHTVVASGAVRIAYGGYRLVAKRVEYDQDTGRMKASGEVALVNPDGTKLYADTLDVTDNFANGFVNGLRIDTTDRTHIVAESAERRGGVETQFNNGVYTACEPCKEHPERAPFWQIKARRVVHDADKKTIRLRDAQFEMFGVPVAYFPYFSAPDQTVKRKSGILRPGFGYRKSLGFALSVPYYQVISPSMDVTLTGTGYTRQGFLAEAEFRQQFRNGFHKLTVAGIDQASPDAFRVGSADRGHSLRGLVASQGHFMINPRWSAGWNVMLESDQNFGRTYSIPGYAGTVVTSEAHLTGLSGRNYFDLHAYHFDEQPADNVLNSTYYRTLERQQPFVLPVIDYNYIPDEPVFGGQLTFTANETSLTRNDLATDTNGAGVTRYRGVSGNDNRLSGDLEWKRTFTSAQGLLLTPILAVRGDAFAVHVDDPGNAPAAANFSGSGTYGRSMETAGLEARYPILAATAHSTHIIEPIAQVFVRPDEPLAGGLPNEDAQSFVFDTTNLFSRNKFSGFDRVEGGTRANLGVRYTGSFDSGITLQSVFGQSYQLAGRNSFAASDLVYAGHDSGLESSASDYVGSFGVGLPVGLDLDAQARFDRSSFELKRTAVGAGYSNPRFSTTVSYAELAPQPQYGSTDTQREISTTASLKFAQNWRVFGHVTYDIERNGISRDGLGLAFNNECFALNLVYAQTKNLVNPAQTSGTDWSIGATLSFRTLGDVTLGSTSPTMN